MEKFERPKIVSSHTEKEPTYCGTIYVTVGKVDGRIIEVFAALGKAGGCAAAQNEALTRTISLGLKYGIPVEEFIEELKEIKCPGAVWSDGVLITSCADAIGNVLRKEVEVKCGC